MRWKPHPNHNRPSTYQVSDNAVSILSDLGYEVPLRGNEAEIPWSICRPLRVLGDLHFKSENRNHIDTSNIKEVKNTSVHDLTESQEKKFKSYLIDHRNYSDSALNVRKRNLSSSVSSGTDSEIGEGDKITKTVDRISSSGNGIIQLPDGHVNVGPIKSRFVGLEVTAEMVDSLFAICTTEEARTAEYTTQFWRMYDDQFYKLGKDTIDSATFCKSCGSVALIENDEWQCGTCSNSFSQNEKDFLEAKLPKPGTVLNGVEVSIDDRSNLCHSSRKQIKINGSVSQGETVDIEIKTTRGRNAIASPIDESDESCLPVSELPEPGAVLHDVQVTTDKDSIAYCAADERIKIRGSVTTGEVIDIEIQNETEGTAIAAPTEASPETKRLIKLREKAKVALTEGSESETCLSESKVPRHFCSSEVQDYVFARANGICEGCEQPAPFTHNSDEPYLHIHQIKKTREVDDDSDSGGLSNIAALCPNCHYRAHHSKHREKYNQKLSGKQFNESVSRANSDITRQKTQTGNTGDECKSQSESYSEFKKTARKVDSTKLSFPKFALFIILFMILILALTLTLGQAI